MRQSEREREKAPKSTKVKYMNSQHGMQSNARFKANKSKKGVESERSL